MAAVHSKYKTAGGRASSALAVDDGRRLARPYSVRGGWLFKVVQEPHILQKPLSVCVQTEILRAAKAQGLRGVRVLRESTGQTFEATFEAFERFGFPVRRGYGDQCGLALCRWQDADSPQGRLGL
jgi:hypothetical protein